MLIKEQCFVCIRIIIVVSRKCIPLQTDSLIRFRGFVKLKKSKNPRKTRKWVGGSSPNSDLSFFGKFCVVLCCFLLYIFLKKIDRGVGGWGLANPSFSRIFLFFKIWQDPLIHVTIHKKRLGYLSFMLLTASSMSSTPNPKSICYYYIIVSLWGVHSFEHILLSYSDI